jgi:hypothetical protein
MHWVHSASVEDAQVRMLVDFVVRMTDADQRLDLLRGATGDPGP